MNRWETSETDRGRITHKRTPTERDRQTDRMTDRNSGRTTHRQTDTVAERARARETKFVKGEKEGGRAFTTTLLLPFPLYPPAPPLGLA